MKTKRTIFLYILMIIAVSLASEVKVYPFGDGIRISLGTPTFFFFLLWFKKIQPVAAGLVTGTAVVIFRITLTLFNPDIAFFSEAFFLHFQVFFYYVTYGIVFYGLRVRTFYYKPFIVGWLGVITEVFASTVEISLRTFSSNQPFTLHSIAIIFVIAILRSFFVLGFFNIIIIREAKSAEEAQKRKTEQLLIMISNLYVEMIQLNKSMNQTEALTSECYDLYQSLKNKGNVDHLQAKALNIAGRIHEIKKDHQRIHTGLSKLMVKEDLAEFINIEEIVHLIVISNQNYSDTLGKTINFQSDIKHIHQHYHTFTMLSIINNLVANAVEAIQNSGDIHINIDKDGDFLYISVSDNGPGISDQNRLLIFEPGFTTKFDSKGYVSNGIGLSYVKQSIEELGGDIQLLDSTYPPKTMFQIKLPIHCLTNRESENE